MSGICSINGFNNNVSFGMAKFTEKGMGYARSCSSVYESLSEPNDFQNPDFFKKNIPLKKAPFAKYVETTLPLKGAISEENVEEVAKTIVDCGTTSNVYTNASFIKQLLTTKKHVDKLDDKTKETIGTAAEQVFQKNWDNPVLSKKETLELLEFAKPPVEDAAYVTLRGVIDTSDAKK